VAHLCCLLISYGPPHYGMGYVLYQLLGGCAPWPGEKRWVLIRFTSVCVGYGLRRHLCCPQLGCGSGPSSDEGGRSPAAGATAEVILPLRGGGGFTVNQRLLATAPTSVLGSGRGTFQVLSGGMLLCAQTCVGGVSTFLPLERATLSWNIRGFWLAFARQKEVPRCLVV
jgi:hypothetical protein